jgi:DNA-binding transcriptional ArsR family regulator
MEKDDMLSRMEDYFHILHLGEKSLDLGKILSSDTSIKILENVYNGDADVGLSASDISEALDVGRTTVIYHLGRMQERGLVKINPILEDDELWKKFWDLYRKKGIDVKKEQFDKLHNAKMNGVKLFVPTKKGFLVLPSTDMKLGQSMVMEALNSITAPVLESDYKKVAKSSSIFGILGLLLIALSLLFTGLPYLQFSSSAATSLSPIEDASYAAAPATMAPATTKAPEMTTALESKPKYTSPGGGGYGGDYGDLAEEKEEVTNISESKKEPVTRTDSKTENKGSHTPKILSYLGTLLLGSVLMFLFYSYIRRK